MRHNSGILKMNVMHVIQLKIEKGLKCKFTNIIKLGDLKNWDQELKANLRIQGREHEECTRGTV